ncbi:hypothetical protein BGZ99_001038 [Dissophora globulifera]|uniref:Thioesterase domain-containing protein n=1 Tax=Dissophora globulifera TaxID=979702 RepID=A0A9P6RTV0_9FUNG|nr:hypothetical protein BGZ99_001038 [Dissophora globulifera]
MAPTHRLAQISAHLLKAPASVTPAGGSSASLALKLATPKLIRNYTSSTSAPPPTESTAPRKVTNKDRAFYPYALDIQSRWADNDQYGHLNNAHYYSLFDTVINTFLIQETGLDPHSNSQGSAIGVVAESGCQYFSSLSFPDMIEARLAVVKLGRSSVVYQVGIFKKLSPAELPVSVVETSLKASITSAGVFTKIVKDVTLLHTSQMLGDAAATGHFCHVFVDKVSRRPVPIPANIRAGLERLQVQT